MTSMAFGLGVVPWPSPAARAPPASAPSAPVCWVAWSRALYWQVFFVPVFFVVVRSLFKGSARQQEMNRRHAEEAGIGNHD